MFCSKCGHELKDENVSFCKFCGSKVNSNFDDSSDAISGLGEKITIEKITEKINNLAGGQGSVELHMRDLFVDVFKKHEAYESEEIFICGTCKTTPSESEIATSWPRPWLYSRVLAALAITYFILLLCWNFFSNENVIPGLIFIGSLMAPFAVLIFFFEINVPRNISIVEIVKVFFVGGCASLLLTLFLFSISSNNSLDLIGATITGIIEEIGKMLIVAYYVSKMNGKKYLLNGIVLGGAVGAGFAVFESAGYAFRNLWQTGSMQQMFDTIYLRAFLSAGGHVAWAAVSGFAIILVMKDVEGFDWGKLIDKKFLSIFLIPIVLHAMWDWDVLINILGIFNSIILIVAIWIVLLVFIDRGLREINEIQTKKN